MGRLFHRSVHGAVPPRKMKRLFHRNTPIKCHPGTWLALGARCAISHCFISSSSGPLERPGDPSPGREARVTALSGEQLRLGMLGDLSFPGICKRRIALPRGRHPAR
jgi:hypothetical protein